MRKYSFLLFLLILAPTTSFAATGLKLCSKAGAVTAKAACAKGEKVVTLGGLSAAANSACTARYGDAQGSGSVDVSAFCNAGETFITHGGYTNNTIGVIQNIELRIQSDTKAVGGVTYSFIDPSGSNQLMDVSAQALCCAAK